MLILAGIASGAGLWYCSETFRSKTRQAGMTVAWYGVRAYTHIEMYTDDVLKYVTEWAGWTPEPETDKPETEMIRLHDKTFTYSTQRTRLPNGKVYVRVGATEDQERRNAAPPQPCDSGIYAPVIRVRKADKVDNGNETGDTLRSFPVDFDGDEYCVVGNVLFDPAFVAHWLRRWFQYELEDGDTWETTFIGEGMVTQKVTHLQRAVCEQGGVRVEDLGYEEPAQGDGDTSPAREPWILDLNGKPPPEAETGACRRGGCTGDNSI